MHDYQVLQSIEKYDCLQDTWNIMYFKLPMPMAKLGAVLCDEPEGILVAGGMNKDFEPMSDVYFLMFRTLEWQEKMPMLAPRLTSSGLIFSRIEDEAFVLAVGGNKTKDCERYSIVEDAWELVPNFKEKVDQDIGGQNNCLFTYGVCSTSRY